MLYKYIKLDEAKELERNVNGSTRSAFGVPWHSRFSVAPDTTMENHLTQMGIAKNQLTERSVRSTNIKIENKYIQSTNKNNNESFVYNKLITLKYIIEA